MKFFGIEINREARSIGDTDDKWYSSLIEAMPSTASGAKISPSTAIRLTAVYCAVKILSEGIASLPLMLYQRQGDFSKEKKLDHFLAPLLLIQPNRYQTAFEFKEVMSIHLLLRGNAYAQIIPTREGGISQLIPLDPDAMMVEQTPQGNLLYNYKRPDGTTRQFKHWQIMHLKSFSLNGMTGSSPITLCREAIGLARAAEDYGARFYENDSTPGGILEHPSKVDAKVHERLKKSWEEVHRGSNKSHRVAILEEGMTWKPISISAKDAQFLEARQFQVEEIARIFNLPPHFLKDLRFATYTNIENQDISFLKHSLRPWLVRWEQTVQKDLISLVSDERIPGTEMPALFSEFKVDALLRGDNKTRNQSYAIGIQFGWLSINDVRAMENMNPIEGGDIHLAPLNMVPVDKLDDYGEALIGGNLGQTSNKKEESKSENARFSNQTRQTFRSIFFEHIAKLLRREEKEFKRITKQERDISAWSEQFYDKQEELLKDSLGESTVAYLEQLLMFNAPDKVKSEDPRTLASRAIELFTKNYKERAKRQLLAIEGGILDKWQERSAIEADFLMDDIEHEIFGEKENE